MEQGWIGSSKTAGMECIEYSVLLLLPGLNREQSPSEGLLDPVELSGLLGDHSQSQLSSCHLNCCHMERVLNLFRNFADLVWTVVCTVFYRPGCDFKLALYQYYTML